MSKDSIGLARTGRYSVSPADRPIRMESSLNNDELRKYAQIGAGERLKELQAEMARIKELLSRLSTVRTPAAPKAAKKAKRKKKAAEKKEKPHHAQTPKARRAASRRMKHLWATGVMGKKKKVGKSPTE